MGGAVELEAASVEDEVAIEGGGSGEVELGAFCGDDGSGEDIQGDGSGGAGAEVTGEGESAGASDDEGDVDNAAGDTSQAEGLGDVDGGSICAEDSATGDGDGSA